jgi:hypothetical protein
VAPGVGLEPARPRRATGSQGQRIIHSAYGKRDLEVSSLSRHVVPAPVNEVI